MALFEEDIDRYILDIEESPKLGNGLRDINQHVDEEDRHNYQNGTFESPRGFTIINESGLYSLILLSTLTMKIKRRPQFRASLVEINQ